MSRIPVRVWSALGLFAAITAAISEAQTTYAPPFDSTTVKLKDAPSPYLARCALCHEHQVGPMLRGRGLTPDYIKFTVRNGSRAMPSFRASEVDDTMLGELTNYLSKLDPALPSQPATETLVPGDAARGNAVYQRSCVTCHGPLGRADGIAAPALKPPPTDFAAEPSINKSAAELLKIIEDGKPGSAMPSWKNALSAQDIQDVLAHVLELRK